MGYHDSNGRYTRTERGLLNVPLGSFWEVDGTALAAFASASEPTPGLALDNSEAAGIRWNNHANPDPVTATIPLPFDRQPGSDVTVVVLASKSGATVGDAVTFDVGAFVAAVGALHDAGDSLGGTTGAMVGNAAAKTMQRVTLAIAGEDIPDAPGTLTLTLQPTDGTLGTDDVTVHAVYLEYSKADLAQ